MKIGVNGLNLIKSFEGCRLTAYKCPAGVWTIGWGHTGGVAAGDTITKEEAEKLLLSDLEKYEKRAEQYNDTYNWNQNEFDALVSFAYNVGAIGQLTAKGSRTKAEIADKILSYNKAAGKVLAGLTRRREAERALFLTPIASNAAAGWHEDGYGKWYQNEGGSFPVMKWQIIDHHWYLFGNSGYALTGWVQWDGHRTGSGAWYYLEESGEYAGALWHGVPDGSGALERWHAE